MSMLHKSDLSLEQAIEVADGILPRELTSVDELPPQHRVRWPTPTSAEGSKIGSQANYGQVGLSNHPAMVGYPTRPKGVKDGKQDLRTLPEENGQEEVQRSAGGQWSIQEKEILQQDLLHPVADSGK